MRKILLVNIFLIITILSAHAQRKSDKPYFEDLSLLRPRVVVLKDSSTTQITTHGNSTPVIPTHTVNSKVDFVLDSISRFNLIRRSVDGYTIQVYSGSKREDAMNAKKKISDETPDLTANLQYQQPKFRVTIGKYYTRLEAYQDLTRVRSGFPSAILIPEKIAIR
ncbi:MAG: SPOR domain-containing protein [Cyclobacteriaceae bacterium]|jgi:hypothetical protein|nr:SPOR domain-containing protein [Cyclobacteriaceae bacterium]